jgi:hypothetical protein
MLAIEEGDVFEAAADALVITVDGGHANAIGAREGSARRSLTPLEASRWSYPRMPV